MNTHPLARSLVSLSMVTAVACALSGRLRADVVTADDGIIQGSLAVGIDAVDNETFGFDTLRLKENNTRISFIDTSASGGFPSNDWQIVANDTASGGRNYLGFRDKGVAGGGSGDELGTLSFYVMAGASDSALMVDSSSRIGLGTASPAMKLHMVTGDTPAMRLDQNNASGFTPQAWDVAGNEVNFFVRDVTGGGRLPFRIRSGAPTSTLDLQANGSVGFGTNAPRAKVDISVNTTTGTEGVLIADPSSAVTANAATLHVEGTAFIAKTLEIGSSRERKENIKELTLDEAEQALEALKPVHFNYKADDEHQLGFIAEDVPDLVATQSRKTLVPMDFVAVLTKVVQKHESRERELEKTVAAQQEILAALAARLDALEKGNVARPAASPALTAAKAAERARRQDHPGESARPQAPLPAPVVSERINNGR